jgi:hypothetical protein
VVAGGETGGVVMTGEEWLEQWIATQNRHLDRLNTWLTFWITVAIATGILAAGIWAHVAGVW